MKKCLFFTAFAVLMGNCRGTILINQADIPYTVTASGTYRLNGDLVLRTTQAPAITVDADDVTINFGTHSLRGKVPGESVLPAITATGHNNLTLRNGRVGDGRAQMKIQLTNVNGLFVEGLTLVGSLIADTCTTGTVFALLSPMGADESTVKLVNSSGILLEECRVASNTSNSGIEISGCTDITCFRCQLSKNGSGIVIDDSSGIDLSMTQVAGSVGDGISLLDNSVTCSIYSNLMINNAGYGMNVTSTQTSYISGNLALRNNGAGDNYSNVPNVVQGWMMTATGNVSNTGA